MTYLKNMIQKIQTTFQVHIHGSISPSQRIENVQYLLPSHDDLQQFDPETLYIGNYQDFHHSCQGRCILLLNCRTDSRKAYLKKEEIFQVLQAGYGYRSMLDTARTYLGNPVTLCTTSFSVLASSPKEYFEDKFDINNKKYYLKNNFIEDMKEKKVLEHIFASTSPIIMDFDDDESPRVSYMFCSIHIRRAAIGYLCVSSHFRPFEERDSSFVMFFVKMLSLEMQKDGFYAEKSGSKYEYFLTDLIEQNLHSNDFAVRYLTQLGETFYQYFWVMGFSFSGFSNHQLNPNYYIDQLLGIIKHSMAFFYKGTLILLLTSKYTDPYQAIDRQKLSHFLQLNQMNAAISYRFEQILDTWRYYNQVIFLLKDKRYYAKEHFITYENNYVNHLLKTTQNKIEAETLIHPDILFLQSYDREHNTEYIKTLKAYFINNRNALHTSNYLHIHKSTFFYRIGKIAGLTKFDLDNASILFTYEFSFYVLNYLKTE